jgi:hypothetical protein
MAAWSARQFITVCNGDCSKTRPGMSVLEQSPCCNRSDLTKGLMGCAGATPAGRPLHKTVHTLEAFPKRVEWGRAARDDNYQLLAGRISKTAH